MSTDRDTTRIVRSWLEDGVTRLPDTVLDAVLDELPTTPQRRATWWPARRLQTMNTTLKFGLAAVVVAVAVLIGINYLAGSSNVGGPGLDGSTPVPTPTSTPPPPPIPLTGALGTLEAGRYAVTGSGISRDIVVEVPAGWGAGDNWVIRGPNGIDPPAGMALRFFTVGNLFNDPAALESGLQDPPVGPTVDDLVNAIVAQEEWTASTPVATTIGGYPAQRVRIDIPDDTEIPVRGREGPAYYLFEDEAGGQVYGWDVSQAFDIYVVDVDGERLVMDAFHFSGTSESDVAALQAMVDSVTFAAAE